MNILYASLKTLLLSFFITLLFANYAKAQNVNIPDANFKAYLLANTAINTVNDGQISVAEAAAFTGMIQCHARNITSLTGIEAFVNITRLECYENQLTSLDVSKNTALQTLFCGYNQLTALDVSKNTALVTLSCRFNPLTVLDVSKNINLTELHCNNNQLTALDVSKNTALKIVVCNNNQLTVLDVSKNIALTSFRCQNNQLTSLNLKNGNNTALNYMLAQDNLNLSCIQVDNVNNAIAKPNWQKDETASYLTYCSLMTYIPDANNIIYVNSNISGGDTKGSNWANAVPELAYVLKWAKEQYDINNTIFDTNPLKIYVAKGTYKPIYRADNLLGTNPQDRENAFVLVPNVQLYGGFDPLSNITDLSHNRILPSNVIEGSILSGDIDDIIGLSATDALHVVVSAGNVGTAKLDGLTISGGYAEINGTTISVNGVNVVRERGAALSVTSSSPQINLVKFKGNYAYAGVVGHSSSSSPTYTNVLMTGNIVAFGTVYNNASNPIFINTTITSNTANNNSSNGVAMRNVTSSNPKLYNSIIWGNRNANLSTNNIFNSSGGTPSAPEYYHSLVQGITTPTNGNLNGNTDPLFTNEVNSDFTLQNASPLIAKGSNSHFTDLTSNSKDLAGTPRVYNNINGGTIDMGAYEYQGMLPQAITFNTLPAKNIGDADFDLTATVNSGLPVSYSSANTLVATISGKTVNIKNAGNAEITASQSGNGDYAAATAVKQNLYVAGTLPVVLTAFTAKTEGSHAKLQWQTTNEENNKGFEIYRSGDDKQFEKITQLLATHNSPSAAYNYIDKQPLNGNNYYKLVQVDNNGKETELGIRLLSFSLSIANIQMHPNPTNNYLKVAFAAGKFNKLEMINLNGEILQKHHIDASQTEKNISLAIYPVGVYTIRLSGNDQAESRKVIKN